MKALLAFLLLLAYPFTLLVYVVGGFALCVWLGWYLGRKTSSILIGITVFSAIFALFYGHEIYLQYQWVNLCKTVGPFIYKTVEANSIFYDDRQHPKHFYENILKREGFEYIEGRLYDSEQLYKFSFDDNGNLVNVLIERPVSRYIYRSERVKYSRYVTGFVTKIIDLENGQPIVISKQFDTEGGLILKTIKSFFSGLGGTSATCSVPYTSNSLRSPTLSAITVNRRINP